MTNINLSNSNKLCAVSLKKVNFKNILYYDDITINAGETTFISGQSGAGKTTLLKLINGLEVPYSGQIIYNHKDINTINPLILRQQILLCNQSIFLFDDTIFNNYNNFYQYRGIPLISESEMLSYLNICCIDFPLDADCSSMSGGERHRVFISICLSLQPLILMLDEPTAALDDTISFRLISNLKTYLVDKNVTLIVVCHNSAIVENFADKIIEL